VRRPAAWAAGVLLLALLTALIPAGRRPFWSSDEARFALLARDVLDSGRWVVAQVRGEPYLNKPQLFFWTVAVVSAPLGRVSELSAAIPAVLASVASVAGVVAIGRLLWGWPAGLLAGLILLTTPLRFEMSHQVLPDVMLDAWLVWALYWFVRAGREGWPRRPLLAFYGCIAVGLLCKGPQALAALVGAAVAVMATEGPRRLRALRPLLGAAIVLALAALVWLLPYQLRSHGGFEHRVLTGHYVTWYFLGSLRGRLGALSEPLVAFMPWTLLLAAAPWWWRAAPDAGRKRLAMWTATLWLLFALSGNYRSRYMLPVFPGLALLTADVLTAPLAGAARRARQLAVLACATLVPLAAFLTLLPLRRLLDNEDVAYLPAGRVEQAILIVLACAGAAALARSARGDVGGGAVRLALALTAIFAVIGVTYPRRYAAAFDVRPLAAAAAAAVAPDGAVIGYPDLRLSYDVYLDHRRVAELRDEAAVRARLAGPPRDAVIMTASRWQTLAPDAHPGWRVLASTTVGDRAMVAVGRRAP